MHLASDVLQALLHGVPSKEQACHIFWIMSIMNLSATIRSHHFLCKAASCRQRCHVWQVLEALQQGASHDALVCCAGYVLGEYGRLVPEVPTHVQFALLQERFLTVSNETKVWTSRPVLVS